MSKTDDVNELEIQLGPLFNLVGQTGTLTWKGKKGVDLAPVPDGIEENHFEDQITFTSIGEVENAEEQVLMAVRYHQQVHRIKDNKLIHDQTGYWLWEQGSSKITHSFTIPRGLCGIALGEVASNDQSIELKVKAKQDDLSIIQIPFLKQKANTQTFEQTLVLMPNKLKYEQIMLIDIYGRLIEHKDVSELTPVIREEFEL